MRIAVIGGAGVMGSTAIKDLVDCRLFEEVVIADRNMKKAETVVKDLKDQETEVSARFVDANRHDSLVKAVRDVDIAASTVGPYYKYAVKVMKGAIDAGVNFIDINDDYDATRKALELNDEAKKAGITAIIGMGESPGRTNILAKYGADKMDRVDEIRIAWVAAIGDPSGIGATDHWFHCVTGMIPIYREGKWVDVPARTEPEIVDFGPPIGNAKVFLCGHGEPVTLPRYIKGVRNVTNKGGVVPSWFMEEYDHIINLGFGSLKALHMKELDIQPRDVTVALLHAILHFASEEMGKQLGEAIVKWPRGGMRTEVIGEKGGEKTRLTYRVTGPPAMTTMAAGTAHCLSLGAQMLAKGKIKVKGAFAPEGCIDPKSCLAEMTKTGMVRTSL